MINVLKDKNQLPLTANSEPIWLQLFTPVMDTSHNKKVTVVATVLDFIIEPHIRYYKYIHSIVYCTVVRGPVTTPKETQSFNLAAICTAMPLYTLEASLVGAHATIGLPAFEVSRISIFNGTCRNIKTMDQKTRKNTWFMVLKWPFQVILVWKV